MSRKKMFTFWGSICLVLIMLGTVLTGCSNSNSSTTAASTTPTKATVLTSAQAEPITLVFTDYEAAVAYHSTEIMQPWFAELEERTGGRVKVEAHYSEELVGLMDTYDAIVKGTVDMGAFLPPHVVGKFQMENIFDLVPFDTAAWLPGRIHLELYQQFPALQAEFNNVQPLLLYNTFVSYTGTTKKPINTLEDGKGLKMIMGGEMGQNVAKALGWTPVSALPPEVYNMWQTGVADGGGVITPGDLVGGFRWGDVIKYVTMVPMNQAPIAVAVNKDKFNSLPADIQQIMIDMMPELTDLADKVEVKYYKEALAQASSDMGVTFITLSSDELAKWMQADQPVIDDYVAQLEAAGKPGKEFYAAFQQLEEKYSADQYDPTK